MNARQALFTALALTGSLAGTEAQQWTTNTLPSGLAAWWAADGNAADSSANHHDGASSGGVSYVVSQYATGFAFDGINGVVEVPDSPELRLTNALSIEFWAKRQRYGIDLVLEKGGDWNLGGEPNYGVGLHSVNNRMFYFFFRGGWRGTSGVGDFNWHHYAVIASHGTANPELYIDGVAHPVEFSEGAATLNLYPSSRPLHLGAQMSPGYNYYGNNVLDDVRIYSRSLTPDEVRYLYEGAPALRLKIQQASPSSVTLSWESIAGKTYALSRSDRPNGDWRVVSLKTAVIEPLSVTVPIEGTTAFFRLIAAPPNPDPEHLVWIPPGTFWMGSPTNEVDRRDTEGPQTVVTISWGFWMEKHETTQGEYEAVMGSNPSWFTGNTNRPVETVTWDEVTNYCAMLTRRERAAGRIGTNSGYRLPTEAEWEYACRAGATTRFSYGDDPGYTNLKGYGWYGENSVGTTHPVEEKLPNAWGLYDMHGNVWEWCQDWYDGSVGYPGGAVTDPQGATAGSMRVIRGSGYEDLAMNCRSALRNNFFPVNMNRAIGFRVVLAPGRP